MHKRRTRRFGLAAGLAAVSTVAAALAISPAGASPERSGGRDGTVRFREIALPGTDLAEYRRGPSPERAIRVANKQRPELTFAAYVGEPVHDRGIAGVVTFDYNGDGNLDIFVTNGPGRPNSLYENQLGRRGNLRFADVAGRAGVSLTSVDANGACAGDIDNDGDQDLYVLGRNSSNHLLKNRGNGTFQDVTTASGTGAGTFSHVSCTMADFDGNGLIDIAIANSFDMKQALAIFAEPYGLNHPNQLLRNVNGLSFTDVSDSSGFTDLDVKNPLPGENPPFADMTWAIGAVDYDQDGDQDIITASDQAAYPMAKFGGHNRGLTRVFDNDGKGHFTDATHRVGTDSPGGWMGLSFGDFNFDGTIDFFDSNAGDYMFLPLPEMGFGQGDLSSRWMLQRRDHTFVDPRSANLRNPTQEGADPSLGGLGATPWGWGTSTLDYNNDGYTDIFYHGSLDGMFWVTGDNPGALLKNKGPQGLRNGFYPSFDYDRAFTNSGLDQRKRTVTGVAVGDLNKDGFDDIVSVAQSRKSGNLTSYSDEANFDFGSPFDRDASFLKTYQRTGGGPAIPTITLRPTSATTVDGNLSVALNSGNSNRSASIRTLGSKGLTPGGQVNRDGIGAVVSFRPQGGPAEVRPVVAGSSFASQDALEGTFGMGRRHVGTAEILWPGGVRNKLFGVRAGERITFPEIPCSYDTSQSIRKYTGCVQRALGDLVAERKLSRSLAQRFFVSAITAYHQSH
ncbi:MAG TPA: VCBS repeat-containing protein [Streptosporangiaceae bacterium]|nr:VCBS repeat-containing protein [Streptosporangiaceae bacterium]